MPSENIFRKIQDKERESIFLHLVHAKREIIIKTPKPDSEIAVLLPQQIIKGRLFCVPKSQQFSIPDGAVILQFSTGDEKYFAQCQVRREMNNYALKLDFDIYLLQRREDFRLRLPRSLKAQLVVTKWKDQSMKAHWALLDISAGGCRIEVPPPSATFAMGQILEGHLEIQGRAAIPVQAEVKHMASSPEDPLAQLVGLQFMQISPFSKERLTALVMDLYRENFSSMKNRI